MVKKTAAHLKNQGAPPKTLKNGSSGTKAALFPAFLVGHCGFYPKLPFFEPNPRPIAELQSYVGVFENFSVGPRSIYVSAVIWGKICQKVGNGDEKRGQKICPPKF